MHLASKAVNYLDAPLYGRLLALIANIRQVEKAFFPGQNTLAYFASSSQVIKKFYCRATWPKVIKRFTSVIYEC
jgi:hypothetical protein